MMARMQCILPDRPRPLHGLAATRAIEQEAAADLPPQTLMRRAGLATARLARALAPHARTAWVVCGPGNNGGDGLEAAMHLRHAGLLVSVTWLGTEARLPPDAHQALQRARAAGLVFAEQPPEALTAADIGIDALVGIGLAPGDAPRPPPPRWRALLQQLREGPACLLSVDLPSGLQCDTGAWAPGFAPAEGLRADCHTLALLTLKPGLFTAEGRDAAGTVWLDTLGIANQDARASAWLCGPSAPAPRRHASHKGSFGDVAVIGGEGLARRGMGMEGAALLAAGAALHAGAGRVLLAPLDGAPPAAALWAPELMQRHVKALELQALTVVCGCGGGEAVADVLPAVLARAARLVLDADALNAIAGNAALQSALAARATGQWGTILTPHPLEAARLLGVSAQAVQADRLAAAHSLAERFGCICVLKGSGTVVAGPGRLPSINPTGNARLATAGTGDVLAGMVGARWAAGDGAYAAACSAVFQHGQLADHWPADRPLVASGLASKKIE
jgi:hydroxyethylthiazole kinase-like uncharacterized protein yjeF